MKEDLLKNKIIADKLAGDNVLSDNELSAVSGGAGSPSETQNIKVNHMTSSDGFDLVIADPSTGFKTGDNVFVEALNKSYTIEFAMGLQYGLGMLIHEKGPSADKYFMSNVRKV